MALAPSVRLHLRRIATEKDPPDVVHKVWAPPLSLAATRGIEVTRYRSLFAGKR
jgi:hypothetical protein